MIIIYIVSNISLRGVVSHRITHFQSRKSFTLAAIVAIYTSEYVSYALILHSLLRHFTGRVASFNMLYTSIFWSHIRIYYVYHVKKLFWVGVTRDVKGCRTQLKGCTMQLEGCT